MENLKKKFRKNFLIINNKKYKVLKKYDRFVLFENEAGFKECFSYFDLGIHGFNLNKYQLKERKFKNKYN